MELAIDPTLYAPMGRLVVSVSALEMCIDFLCCEMIGSGDHHRVGQILFAGLPMSTKIAKMSSLFQHRVSAPAALEAMATLRRPIEEVVEQRNRFVHSTGRLAAASAFRRPPAAALPSRIAASLRPRSLG